MNRANIRPSDETSLVRIKNELFGQKENFFLRDQRGKSERARKAHLSHLGRQLEQETRLILPACGRQRLQAEKKIKAKGPLFQQG